jgi:hypothetical protein
MACNNSLTHADIQRVKKAVEPLGLVAIEKVPEALWEAHKAITSRQRGDGPVVIYDRELPGGEGTVEPARQELSQGVKYIGGVKTIKDAADHVTWVGNERVHRDIYGVATHIGDRRIYQWLDGSEKYVEYDRVHFDIYGNVKQLGDEAVTPAR